MSGQKLSVSNAVPVIELECLGEKDVNSSGFLAIELDETIDIPVLQWIKKYNLFRSLPQCPRI